MAKESNASKAGTVNAAPGGIAGAIAFSRESVEELKKVHAPTRQETLRITLVVIILLAFFAVFLGLADFLVGKLMQTILT